MYHAALDTSLNCTLAIAKDDQIIFNAILDSTSRDNDRKLPPWILESVKNCQIELKDIQRWTVGTGPGSFAGLRAGISHIMGICAGTGASIRGLPSAIAIADIAEPNPGDKVGVIMDGRCGEIILVIVQDKKIIGEPCAILPDELNDERYCCDIWITPQPDLIPPLPDQIQDELLEAEAADPAVLMFLDQDQWPQSQAEAIKSCEPIYVRPPVFVEPKPVPNFN